MIVGVTGQARSGKDTLAAYLSDNHNFVRIGLADPLKRICKDVFDFNDAQLWGDERDLPDRRYLRGEKVTGAVLSSKYPEIPAGSEVVQRIYLTPRFALQLLGTEWGRTCYNDVWIEYGIRVAKELLSNPKLGYVPSRGLFTAEDPDDVWPPTTGVVFSDLRFKNEFEAVRKAGGLLVRVKREDCYGDVGIENHPSEAEQKTVPDSYFDLVLENPDGLENYYKMIREVLIPRLK